jgi:hypothetical protein
MDFDGVRADDQLAGNLFVARAGGNQPQDFALALAQFSFFGHGSLIILHGGGSEVHVVVKHPVGRGPIGCFTTTEKHFA